jgi:hypothetical protein
LATAACVIPLLKDTAVEVDLDSASTSVVQLLLSHRVDRFFLVLNTKTGRNIPNGNKLYQTAIKNFQWP